MKKRTILFAFVLFSTLAWSQTWVTFSQTSPTEPRVELSSSSTQQVSFSVDIGGMYKTDIPENGTNYQRISIPGNMVSNDAGEPELPIVRKLIAIPECDNVSLTANVTSQNTYSNYLIYPSPDLYEVNNADGSSYPAESFTINNAAYSQTNAIPGVNAEIASIGYLRG